MSNSANIPTLFEAFSFNADVLAKNRSGILTGAQVKRVQQYQQVRGCGQRAAAIALGVTAVAFFAIAMLLDAPGIETARPFLIGFSGGFGGLFLLALARDYLAGRDLAQGRISVMEGSVQTWSKEIKTPDRRLGTAYFFKIGRKTYQLETAQQMAALQENQPYRIYFVKNGRVPIILSVKEI
ncbi:hypothetical protein [Candidatus Leptofilum sp.]|uniref:hypothetical protein n=1 Tax=Candidatus Leptofilum sp. TaxID=3241576 RepID=UPI003B5D043E